MTTSQTKARQKKQIVLRGADLKQPRGVRVQTGVRAGDSDSSSSGNNTPIAGKTDRRS